MPDSKWTAGELNLDGQPSWVAVDAWEFEAIHLPLMREWVQQWRQRREPFIVLLGGPPGAGKSTLAGVWELLSREGRIDVPVESLSMDGFHYPNRWLDSQWTTVDGAPMPLRRIKGRPETFDLMSLRQALLKIRAGEPMFWPRYDRTLHDPLPDAISVASEGIVVIEGLYMLLDQPGWRDLRSMADFGVFLECPEDVLRADLVARKVRQGRSPADATAHYELVDHYTWQLTMRRRQGVNALLQRTSERRLQRVASFAGELGGMSEGEVY